MFNKIFVMEKFPCGYKYIVKARGFNEVKLHDTDKKGCPLHGKKCKAKGGR